MPVIAVFGSSEAETLGPAEAVGAEVARQRAILLTGGGRGQGRPAVKESAMDGAEELRRQGYVAARVGVLGREEAEVGAEVEDEGTRLVLAPACGDRRNYLNACLCDVAVAFHGAEGTKSEVAFSLALGRAVILLGEGWTGEYPVVRDRAAYDAFVGASRTRVPGDGDDDLDHQVADAYARLDADREWPVDHLPLDHPAREVVELARERASETGSRGRFPDLPALRGLATAYDDWVAEMAERLRDQSPG